MRFVGEGFVADTDAFTLEYLGELVDLEPQAMDLLIFMLERPGQLLTKADLIDNVWRDSFVGESALTTRIKQVRSAIGDDGRNQRQIKTVHGRGYTFVGEVTEAGGEDDDPMAAAPPVSVTPHNLPTARTELIGRSRLVGEIVKTVTEQRLVTLVGFGGAGKTSAALEAGRRLAASHTTAAPRDGVWFVDLIPVADDVGLDDALARAMGLQLGSGPARPELLSRLANRQAIVILDNCEHVVDQAAALAGAVLDHAPHVRLLATSREPLHLVGECRVPVDPLPVVDAEGGAIDLLEAVARRSGAVIADDEKTAAVELCKRVDGLPLAIELVGARLAHLSVAEVIARLDRVSAGRGPNRRPDRHASLATVLDATVGGLTLDAHAFLTVLARVNGSFGIDDAEAIAHICELDDPDAVFAELAERSLVARSRVGGRPYRVLETVRQHMATDDDDPAATDARYVAWCLDAVGTTVAQHFYDLHHANWVMARFSDLQAATRICADAGRHDDAARLASGMALALHLDDGSRAAQMLRVIGATSEQVADPAALARLHSAGVMAGMAAREHTKMYDHGQAVVPVADRSGDDSLRGLARILRSWGEVVADPARAVADVDDAIEIARQVGDTDTETIAIGYKVFHLAMALRFDEAVAVGSGALTDTFDAFSYPQRVVATGLMCIQVLDNPESTIRLDALVGEGMPAAGFWGSAIIRACAHASLGDLGTAIDVLVDVEARLERAGVVGLPDLLLVPAAVAHQAGDSERAGYYLGAVRAAERPTQSLIVSTAYRALRNQIDAAAPTAIEATTDEIWRGARRWLTDTAAG